MNRHRIEMRFTDQDGPQSEVAFERAGEADMDELYEAFKAFLVAIGYHPDTIKEFLEPPFQRTER